MEKLDKLLKIISNEYRYKIFLMLLDGEKCVCEIIPKMNLSQPLASYHLKILKKRNIFNLIININCLSYFLML